ncbi:uncharacterized protein A4U43_C10F8180 [Asparagus officinalis]|nr:uncharacterized protein A4U43_C10F8180 [Asparagus officinalis]
MFNVFWLHHRSPPYHPPLPIHWSTAFDDFPMSYPYGGTALDGFPMGYPYYNIEAQPHKPRPTLVKWAAPEPDWMKLNFDGAVSKGVAGCGYALRDSEGAILAAGCCGAPDLNVLDAELRGLWSGLKLAAKVCKRGQKLWIEGDSLVIIDYLKEFFVDYPNNQPVVQDIIRLLDHFSEIQASHIYREGNAVADWLAGKGKYTRVEVVWTSDFPDKLEALAQKDLREYHERRRK